MRITSGPAPAALLGDLDLADPHYFGTGDPHPVWTHLRGTDPVHRQCPMAGRPEFWAVTRHADVSQVLAQHEEFTAARGNILTTLGHEAIAGGQMLAVTDPQHRRLKDPLAPYLSSQAVRAFEPALRELARRLLAVGATTRTWDFAAQSMYYPIAIAGLLLGTPESGWEHLKHYTYAAVAESDPDYAPADAGTASVLSRAHSEIFLFAAEVAKPGRAEAEDLIGSLLRAAYDGVPLTRQEVILNAYSLLIGATVTTSHAAIAGLLALLENPGEYARWTSTGDTAALVEEILRWASLLPHLDDTRFLHMYGPTECTLFATGRPIETVDTTRPTIPIGRPIANTQAYVLDEQHRPVPVGVPGEGLAREYLGRPDLTEERFPPNPFGPPGSRMYRTGDLARLLPEGELEFLGRGDDQVKVCGYRIELGEVDATLAAHPEVGAVATVAREDAPGGRALVSYLVGERLPDDAQLRAFVGSRLPSYMTPAAFVRLPEMPLTANGKVDRKALPAPEFSSAAGLAAPGDPVEELVRTAVAETLGLHAVGPDDEFFEIGGNSLLPVDLFTRLQTAFPADPPTLVDLLEHRTPSAVARLLAKRTATEET
ncbi:hypothetical protein ELQ87_39205 [Streptomyces griseoviridis]|uniref:Carrier domain-containing protein n=1 Tax=Streptomyces griseoviridis TaxID=45398 RepID=A0A3S9ZP04_STRGD|nr:AMP-binding protein [Streptomyces griseoviridis]AZS89606.1 hypothetical protein ELQ87_39205 [Streptomyces griseoviridis]QCN83556.1 hypothetical protein DDJ31_00030 [Streptomyces griseoviridis]